MDIETTLDRLWPRKPTAKRLGLAPETLEAWACRGNSDLPYIKVGGRAMYSERDIVAFIERHRATSATAHRALVTA